MCLIDSDADNSCVNSINKNVTTEEILELQKKLQKLKHNGGHFCQVLKTLQEAKTAFNRVEKNVLTIRDMTNDFTKLIFETGFGEKC